MRIHSLRMVPMAPSFSRTKPGQGTDFRGGFYGSRRRLAARRRDPAICDRPP